MSSRIEILVLAIGSCNAAFTPESKSFELSNPLMIRSFATVGKHETDGDGVRVFPSLINGLKAGFFDCQLKLSGKSRAGLSPTDTLESLLRVYGIREPGGVSKVISFLRRAAKNPDINKETPLSFFLEGAECPTPQPTQ